MLDPNHMKRKVYWWNAWSVISIVILILVVTPILSIFLHVFDAPGPIWEYISKTLLSRYIYDTLVLLVGVCFFTFIIGTSLGWLVSAFEFPGRKILEWLVILPMAFPAYMMAYSYVGILEFTGPFHAFLRNQLGLEITGPIFDIMDMKGAIFILTLSLFPYVYVFSRSSFTRRSREFQEASLLLGKTPLRTFFSVGLPMARPAIAGGLALVAMEVLNDYGTVKYFGVNTFTTGIFRSWFSLGDLNTGVRLAGMLTLLVFILLLVEFRQRGRKGWVSMAGQQKAPLRTSLRGWQRWATVSFCWIVLMVSFILPLLQILYWVNLTASKVMNLQFFMLMKNSFLLAFCAAVIILVFAILLLYANRVSKVRWSNYITSLAILGYAIPGAVIALGIRIPLVNLDKWLITQFSDVNTLLFSGGLFILVFAYLVRFMAVGYQAISSGFSKSGMHIHEASRILGGSTWQTLWRVELPLVKNSIAAGLLLVFVDLIKELPLTLILRPFNFDTLATRAFDLATNEQIAESANASLVVVLIGVLPIVLLNNLITTKNIS